MFCFVFFFPVLNFPCYTVEDSCSLVRFFIMPSISMSIKITLSSMSEHHKWGSLSAVSVHSGASDPMKWKFLIDDWIFRIKILSRPSWWCLFLKKNQPILLLVGKWPAGVWSHLPVPWATAGPGPRWEAGLLSPWLCSSTEPQTGAWLCLLGTVNCWDLC